MSRNNANPIIASHMVYSPEGATSNGIQVPTYSSITTARGSSPQYFSITFDVQTPIRVVATIKKLLLAQEHKMTRASKVHTISTRQCPQRMYLEHQERIRFQNLWRL